jgi:molybdopterin-guanine dinucleotide biosynthesis protein A
MKPSSLYGLVLSGGQSLRMGRDKGSLVYSLGTMDKNRKDQRTQSHDLLARVCEKVFISIRPGQENLVSSDYAFLLDSVHGVGPGIGILTAATAHPHVAWFVLACDFPFADENEIERLASSRNPEFQATAMIAHDDQVEPLFTIWEPPALQALARDFSRNQFSPRKTLNTLTVQKIIPLRENSLLNVNAEADLSAKIY